MIEKKISEYIRKKFILLRESEDIDSFVKKFFDRIIYILQDDEVVGVGVYLWINEKALDIIHNNKMIMSTPEGFNFIENMPGDNMHFFAISSDNPIFILKSLKKIMKDKKPKTVSWIDPSMKNFHCFRGDK